MTYLGTLGIASFLKALNEFVACLVWCSQKKPTGGLRIEKDRLDVATDVGHALGIVVITRIRPGFLAHFYGF